MSLKQFLFKEDDAGLIGFIIPITLMFFLVMMFHLLAKIGWDVPGLLLEPVFNLYIVIVGVLIAVCAYMRQFVLLILACLISFVVTVLIYVMYVIP